MPRFYLTTPPKSVTYVLNLLCYLCSEPAPYAADWEIFVSSWDPGKVVGMSKQYSAPPTMTIDPNKKYSAAFNTSRGEIVCELFAKDAPKTVNNFVFLARDKFYDGTVFHRVIPDFMIQGGDPTGTGRGGPGYQFEDEFNEHKVDRGALAMANAGPNTNGSQFFIVTADACPWLDGKHTVLGRVTSGMEIADTISQLPSDSSDKPRDDALIERVELASEGP